MTGIYAAGPNGEHLGPYSADALCDEIIAGRMPESVLVWWEGAAGWVALHTEPNLAAHLTERRSAPARPLAPVESPPPQPIAPAPLAAPAEFSAPVPEPAPEPAPAPAPEPAPAPAPEPAPLPAAPEPVADDDELDEIFAGLVKSSWDYYRQVEKATRTDEVLLGALVTSTLDNGYALIDLTSDGANHFTRFEEPNSRARITLALTHLTGDLVAAKVLGQRASVVVGYGEPVADFQRIWQGVKAEVKSGYIGNPEPGTVTVDADVSAGYLYTQVDLYLDLAEYLDEELNVNYDTMTAHLGAVVNALRKYLYARITG